MMSYVYCVCHCVVVHTHRENRPVTQTTLEPTLLSWGGWPRQKYHPEVINEHEDDEQFNPHAHFAMWDHPALTLSSKLCELP